MPFRLSLAQINPTVGDLSGNAEKIIRFARRAEEAGADMVLFPELSLTGYPPEDLLLLPRFVRDAGQSLKKIASALPPWLACVLGTVDGRPGHLFNAAAVAFRGRARAVYRKKLLPNYGVFDERRYFLPGGDPLLVRVGGRLVGLTICEDIWFPRAQAWEAVRRGAGLIVNISASPYHAGKLSLREKILRDRVRECRVPFAYCNLVGGQDELVFDGGSLVYDAGGRLLARAPQFREDLLTLDLDIPPARRAGARAVSLPAPNAGDRPPLPAPAIHSPLPAMEEIYSAILLCTRDYFRKNGFQKAVVGLSGGIDSALTACMAVDALGRDNVIGVTLPSRFNAPETRADAAALAHNLGIAFHTIPIDGVVRGLLTALESLFAGHRPDVAEENLQARVRGTILMALSNKFGWLVLTTGNKSEISVGYCTLYGDMAGGFAVLKDVPKTLLYRLARWRNERENTAPIPETTFTRPPTAELRENQKDQDTLPPYEVLDRIVELYVEGNKGLAEMSKKGADQTTAARVLRMIDAAEYKRRQSPPGVKITPRAFGRDRRMPITNRYKPA